MTPAQIPPRPTDIKREGPYKVYKGVEYAVFDDGNSAETPYQTDLAVHEHAVAVAAVRALKRTHCTCFWEYRESGENHKNVCRACATLAAITASGWEE